MTRSLALSSLIIVAISNCALADIFGTGANQFKIDFVTIGNPGNEADTSDGDQFSPGIQHYGAVSNAFRMGKFEISERMIDAANAQSTLGITRDTRGATKPATGISWLEAASFVNWLNTSSGGTPVYKFDAGNFVLWQPGDAGYDAANTYRNKLANYFLPSIDEWYSISATRYTAIMAENDTTDREAWRQRPWAIVLLILLAISFGGQLVLGAPPLALIGSSMLLAGWTAQLTINLRRARQQ